MVKNTVWCGLVWFSGICIEYEWNINGISWNINGIFVELAYIDTWPGDKHSSGRVAFGVCRKMAAGRSQTFGIQLHSIRIHFLWLVVQPPL